jgi:glycosyltransferase involved in cell wall biosynthesis
LVNPEIESEIVTAIENYINTPELANQHSMNARRLVEESKNWESESKKLIELVNKLLL